MTGKYHLMAATATGAAASVIYALNSGPEFVHFLNAGSIFISSSIAGLLPDIDLPKSTAGKCLKPISWTINKLFGHRTITHSGLWLIVLFVLLYKTEWAPYLIGTSIGFLSHMCTDTMTAGGVPWLYPLSKKRIRLTFVESGKLDFLFTVIISTLLILAMVFYHCYINGLIRF